MSQALFQTQDIYNGENPLSPGAYKLVGEGRQKRVKKRHRERMRGKGKGKRRKRKGGNI